METNQHRQKIITRRRKHHSIVGEDDLRLERADAANDPQMNEYEFSRSKANKAKRELAWHERLQEEERGFTNFGHDI